MEQIWESLSVILIPPWTDDTALLCWCVFLGVMGVFFYMKHRRATLGKAIGRLLDLGATTEEKAVKTNDSRLGNQKWPKGERLFVLLQKDGEEMVYLPEDRLKKANYLLKASGGKASTTALVIFLAYAVMVAAYYLTPTVRDLLEILSQF